MYYLEIITRAKRASLIITLVMASFAYPMEKPSKEDQPKATTAPVTDLSRVTNLDSFVQLLANGANPNYTGHELQEPGDTYSLKNRAATRFLFGAQLSPAGLQGLAMDLPFPVPSQWDQNCNSTLIDALQRLWQAIINGDEEQFKHHLNRIVNAVSSEIFLTLGKSCQNKRGSF
jgi:hypothetical protein